MNENEVLIGKIENKIANLNNSRIKIKMKYQQNEKQMNEKFQMKENKTLEIEVLIENHIDSKFKYTNEDNLLAKCTRESNKSKSNQIENEENYYHINYNINNISEKLEIGDNKIENGM
ncbi:hypothetical protein U3516DRAFT_751668 [Neocallimastix sp. 'constans']